MITRDFHKFGNYCYIDENEITAKVGGSFVKITSDHISLKAESVYIQGNSLVAIEGGEIKIDKGVEVPDEAVAKQDIAKPSIDAIKEINEKDKQFHT